LILEKGGGEKAKKRGFPRDSFITWELVVVETGEERRETPGGKGGIWQGLSSHTHTHTHTHIHKNI
jgi:hypothetical protein